MENLIIQSNKKTTTTLNNNNNYNIPNNLFLQETNENTNLATSQITNQPISPIKSSNPSGFDSFKQKLKQSVSNGKDLNSKLKFFNINLNKPESENQALTHQTTIMEMRINNFEKFIKDIRSGMAKCKYRKTLEDISSREELFTDLEHVFWRVREHKVKCMLKILEKKMFQSDAPANQKQKSIETWTFKIENEIEIWIGMLSFLKASENNEAYEEQIESLIHVILEEFYLQAQFKYAVKQFPETVAILGLAEKIIKHFCDLSRSFKVTQSAQKILLFISSFLISDNDYVHAKEYQVAAVKLAFRELFLRSDLDDGINYEAVSKTNQHFLNKIFLNIINAFYQRGVCDENLGEMRKAIDSYKQAVWFSNNFVKYQYPELSQFIADVEQRAKDYHKIIKKINEKFDSSDYYNNNNKKPKKAKRINSNNNNNNNNNNINYTTEGNESAGITLTNPYANSSAAEKKNASCTKAPFLASPEDSEEFKQMLESIKHQDFEFSEDDKKSERIKQLMSTINLLNNFSSDKFRDIIKIMPNLNLENLDRGLIDKIQKRLNDIRAEKTFSEMEKNKAEVKNKNRIIESNNLKAELEQYLNKDQKLDANGNINAINLNNINLEKNYKISVNMFLNTEKLLSGRNTEATSPSTNLKKTKTNFTVQNTNENQANENQANENKTDLRPRPQSYRIRKDPAKKIEKFNHNEYIFSAGFQGKLKNINELMKKETEFQKKLLRLKKFEKLPLELKEINMNAIKDEAKNFFERAKSTYKSGYVFPNENQAKKSNTLKDIEKNKREKQKQKLEVALIKSLDTKVFSMLEQIKKIEEKNDNLIREEFINDGKSSKDNKFDFEKINSQYKKKIEKDLSFLQKREKMCKRIIEEDIKNMNSNANNKKQNKDTSNNNNNQNLKSLDMQNINNFGNPINNFNHFNRTTTGKFPMTTRNFESNKPFDKNFEGISGCNKNKNCEKNVHNKKPKIDVDKFVQIVGSSFDRLDSALESPIKGRNNLNDIIGINSLSSHLNNFN